MVRQPALEGTVRILWRSLAELFPIYCTDNRHSAITVSWDHHRGSRVDVSGSTINSIFERRADPSPSLTIVATCGTFRCLWRQDF